MFGQLHNCKVSFPQGAEDLIEAHLQWPSLGRTGLSPLAVLCHDHHSAPTAMGRLRLVAAQTKELHYVFLLI